MIRLHNITERDAYPLCTTRFIELCVLVCVISYLLYTQAQQSYKAARSELVPIISKSELPVAIVAPTIHLQSHEESMSVVVTGEE